MVAAGNGYTMLPLLATLDRADLSDLTVYRPPESASFGRTISLAFRASDPRGRAFMFLAELLREIAPAGTRAVRPATEPGP